MTRSDTISKIAPALAKAQKHMTGAAKTAVNPHLKSKYPTLADVVDACFDALNDQEIGVLQPVRSEGQTVIVSTMLLHSSGEWIAEDLALTAQQNTPQAIGSAITYGRRYGLAAMVGVAPEDDDGEASSNRQGYTVTAPAVSSAPKGLADDAVCGPVGPERGGASGHSVSTDTHSYATTQNTKPLPDLPEAAVRIERVDTAPTKREGVIQYRVRFSNGALATTIKSKLGALCEQLAQENRPIIPETKDTRWGLDLLAVHPVEALLPDIPLHEPVDVDDIAF